MFSNFKRNGGYLTLYLVALNEAKKVCLYLVQRGIDIYKVAKLQGHEDVKMTQLRYAHHCPDSLRGGVEILDSDYNLTTIGEK